MKLTCAFEMLYANDRYQTSSAFPSDVVPVEPKQNALWEAYKSRLLQSGRFHGHVEGEPEYQGPLHATSLSFHFLFVRKTRWTKSNQLRGGGTIDLAALLQAGWQRYCDVCAYERTNAELSNPSRRCRVRFGSVGAESTINQH